MFYLLISKSHTIQSDNLKLVSFVNIVGIKQIIFIWKWFITKDYRNLRMYYRIVAIRTEFTWI